VIQLVNLTREAMKKEQEWRERLMEKPHAWTSTESILGVEVPKYTMAVAPGRDVAIMVETAVRRCLLAERGIHDERDFLDAINRIARGERPDGGREPTG
jgi:serine kinase of HPr protein (carbohydrate metabolism regulator)